MRKKQANLYSIPEKISTAPYLTPDQLKQFESEFTLFDQEIETRKLRDTLTLMNKNENQNYKPLQSFVTEMAGKRARCTFPDYLQEIMKYTEKHNECDLILEIIGDQGNKSAISQSLIKQILEETLNVQLKRKQINEILLKIFDIDSLKQSDPIPKAKIAEVLENASHR